MIILSKLIVFFCNLTGMPYKIIVNLVYRRNAVFIKTDSPHAQTMAIRNSFR
ncbi:hypothetical protein SAMN05444366_2832 [Flavobacterium saccharophilum]|uniref:Uncharacterized protein n=1 Tax=Flavobacterium saccharophilum TaxID=29534 RepID=A0A1M7HQT6_9FLAO|nr:hypothetical protein SAMN05444366_2832 [Flavobacterium saccharophilum]